MPPKTRGGKNTKASKENIGLNAKNNVRTTGKVTKSSRKVLADKTNSASDDNASIVTSKPTLKCELIVPENALSKQRPRRERRPPTRFIENNVLQNLSNSQNVSIENQEPPKHTPIKKVCTVVISPLKTPETFLDSSLTARRPKRICRLPSKFHDHSISPSKFIPVQPVHASTPKVITKDMKTIEDDSNQQSSPKKPYVKEKVIPTKINKKKTVGKKANNISKNSSADTNNNAKQDLKLPQNKPKNKPSTTLKQSPDPKAASNKKIIGKNNSFRVLEGKKSLKRDASKIDVYEFTFDPNEEPPPQKKKRKRPQKKKEPKMVTFKNNYDKNVAKALTALKNMVSTKNVKHPENHNNEKVQVNKTNKPENPIDSNIDLAKKSTMSYPVNSATANVKQSPNIIVKNNPSVTTAVKEPSIDAANKTNVSHKNYNSVRVEDIALDFEEDSVVNDMNYSPINSPCRPITPVQAVENQCADRSVHNDDPLNLREDLSFFDDQPVASSSMMSTRHPTASPWRTEFEKLPIKWQVNTYVKPNMTPALESSFISLSDNKKKHVYTNMVADTDDANLPNIFDDNNAFKQTSIMSFIKEVAERNAKKRKEKLTPIKANSLFEYINSTSICMEPQPEAETEKSPVTPLKNSTSNKCVTPQNQPLSNNSTEKCTSSGSSKEVNKDSSTESAKSSSKKKKDKDITYFGFDDCENQDQENVSRTKKIDKKKLRALRPRSRAVLQEINAQKGPMRAVLPVAAKTKPLQSSDKMNQLFDDVKSATEPPVFPDKEPEGKIETATEIQSSEDMNNDDSQSVHLFEDLDVVHHIKPHRKSYGKSKKVAFRQNSVSDSDIPTSDVAEQSGSSDEDDLHDLTFKIPAMETKKATRKKKTNKQKLSKKEEKEAEAWAAGFNSMCEDIEEFDLVVE